MIQQSNHSTIKHSIKLTTRDKILETSKKLFSQQGFGEPTLNSIAQTIGISRGNLTYYFKDKEELLDTLVAEMWQKYEQSIGRAMKFPSWESTNDATHAYLSLQKEYAFIFFDIKIAANPKVTKQIGRMKKDTLERQMATIAFSIQIGNMKPEVIPGTYRNLCESLWMINFYWLISVGYRNESESSSKVIWSSILPHFTQKGLDSFIKHFGKDYYESLGEAFDSSKVGAVVF